MDKPPLYIYIGGYGRSGSTILDLYLSAQGSFSVGEFICFQKNLKVGKPCSCGKTLEQCDVWSDLASQYSRKSLFWHADAQKLLSLIENHGCVVESSKTAWNAIIRGTYLLLRLHGAVNIKYVHVFRHPYHVMQSICRGSNKQKELSGSWGHSSSIFSPLRTLVNFYVSIVALFIFPAVSRCTSVVVDFDKWCDVDEYRTEKVPRIDERFLNIGPKFIVDKLRSQHMVDGNRLRLQEEISVSVSAGVSTIKLRPWSKLLAILMLPGYFFLQSKSR